MMLSKIPIVVQKFVVDIYDHLNCKLQIWKVIIIFNPVVPKYFQAKKKRRIKVILSVLLKMFVGNEIIKFMTIRTDEKSRRINHSQYHHQRRENSKLKTPKIHMEVFSPPGNLIGSIKHQEW